MGKTSRKSGPKKVASARSKASVKLDKTTRPEKTPQLKLKEIYPVGGHVHRNWSTKWPMNDLSKAIAESGRNGTNSYIFLHSESLDKSTHSELINRDGDENVPILVVVSSPFPPTDFIATYSVQLQQEEMTPMSKVGLKWEKAYSGVFFLKSTRTNGDWADVDKQLLPLLRPSQILEAVPEKVETIHINFKGIDIMCDRPKRIALDVDELIEDEDLDASDRNEVIGLLEQQKAIAEKNNREALDAKIRHFREMTDALAETNTDVLGKLERVKVFKVYPSNLPPPTKTWMGVETGFRKTLFVNRYIGNADGMY